MYISKAFGKFPGVFANKLKSQVNMEYKKNAVTSWIIKKRIKDLKRQST